MGGKITLESVDFTQFILVIQKMFVRKNNYLYSVEEFCIVIKKSVFLD